MTQIKNQNLIEISQKTKRKIQLIPIIIPKESLRLEDSILQSINKGLKIKKVYFYRTRRIECGFLLIFFFMSFAFPLDFSQYPSQSFEREYSIPPTYRLQSNGWEYKDENNISVGEIKANFAGKFCVVLHSCGSGCRFYSLLDLENGREDYEILSDFNTIPDEGDKLSIDKLITHKESNLLVVQSFFLDNSCKQSSYLLENIKNKNSLKMISKDTKCMKE